MKQLTRIGLAFTVAQLTVLAPVMQAQQTQDSVQVAATAVSTTTVPETARTTADSLHAVSNAARGPVASTVALRMRPVEAPAPAPIPQSRSNATAMMVVGLAAVITGIAVGDDAGTILVLAGAGIGLYGLYKFMQ